MQALLTTKESVNTALGVLTHDGRTVLFYRKRERGKNKLFSLTSPDGLTYMGDAEPLTIRGKSGLPLKIDNVSAISAAIVNRQYFLSISHTSGKKRQTYLAVGLTPTNYKVVGKLPGFENCCIAADYVFKDKLVAYVGGSGINLATSQSGAAWRLGRKSVISPTREGATLIPALSQFTPSGVMLLYYEVQKYRDGKPFYTIRATLFDAKNPAKPTWQSKHPLWEEPRDWIGHAPGVSSVGLALVGNRLVSFWRDVNTPLFAILHMPQDAIAKDMHERSKSRLIKHTKNPIISPRSENFWESKATFNPAAIFTQGKVHIIYRAIGDADMSMLGYASSSDGVHIDERLADPVYVPTQPFEYTGTHPVIPHSPYASGGGGFGGIEDPRLTKIGNRLYMTYVAYDGCNPPRVALTSIVESDFLGKKWRWDIPVLISPPGVVDKNAVIFPERINGKFVIMHRIFPDILIDFVDSLDFDGRMFLKGQFAITPTKTGWDSRKIGAGPPPLKTDVGWLLIYHAVDDHDDGSYKMGAMILDKYDPTRVVARTIHPILEPDQAYENVGYKAGVAYPCGAVTIDDMLYVYYGGADTVTCVATAPLSSFIDTLINYHSAQFAHIEQVR